MLLTSATMYANIIPSVLFPCKTEFYDRGADRISIFCFNSAVRVQKGKGCLPKCKISTGILRWGLSEYGMHCHKIVERYLNQ